MRANNSFKPSPLEKTGVKVHFVRTQYLEVYSDPGFAAAVQKNPVIHIFRTQNLGNSYEVYYLYSYSLHRSSHIRSTKSEPEYF
jgi:hypothetical protein